MKKPGTFASDEQIKSLLTIHKAKNISVTKYQMAWLSYSDGKRRILLDNIIANHTLMGKGGSSLIIL